MCKVVQILLAMRMPTCGALSYQKIKNIHSYISLCVITLDKLPFIIVIILNFYSYLIMIVLIIFGPTLYKHFFKIIVIILSVTSLFVLKIISYFL